MSRNTAASLFAAALAATRAQASAGAASRTGHRQANGLVRGDAGRAGTVTQRFARDAGVDGVVTAVKQAWRAAPGWRAVLRGVPDGLAAWRRRGGAEPADPAR